MSLLPPSIRGLILDMDGVIWKADAPIGNLPAIFAEISRRGLNFVFATNNSTRTPQQYVDQLARLGVAAEPWQVITSSLAAADLIARRLPAGAPVFAIGEDGLTQALIEKKLTLVPAESAENAQAVVIGIDRKINFQKMAEAALLIRRGLPFYATNLDKTFPTPRGQIPGAGAWAQVLMTASGIEPIVAGKPSAAMMELALERLSLPREAALVVGDRLETDIAAGQAARCPTALVLSGVSSRAQAEAWQPKIGLIASDLAELIGAA
ncbi:MAG: HAD-IIA family hydrolase [Anaerolineales bacterium]